MAGYTDADLHLFQRLLIPHDDAGHNFRRMTVVAVAARRHMLKVFDNQIDKTLMINISGGCDDQVARIEPLLIGVEDHLLLECLYRFLGAEYWLAQRVILPKILGEDLMHQVIRVVLVHLDLFENHSALTDNVLSCEDRIEHQVA